MCGVTHTTVCDGRSGTVASNGSYREWILRDGRCLLKRPPVNAKQGSPCANWPPGKSEHSEEGVERGANSGASGNGCPFC